MLLLDSKSLLLCLTIITIIKVYVYHFLFFFLILFICLILQCTTKHGFWIALNQGFSSLTAIYIQFCCTEESTLFHPKLHNTFTRWKTSDSDHTQCRGQN